MIAEAVLVLGLITVVVKLATRKKPHALPAKPKPAEKPRDPYRTADVRAPEPEAPQPEEPEAAEPEAPARAVRAGKVRLIDRSVTVHPPPELRTQTMLVAYEVSEETDRVGTEYARGEKSGVREESTSPRTVTASAGCMFFLETADGRIVVDARHGFQLEGKEKLLFEEELRGGQVLAALSIIDDISKTQERTHQRAHERRADRIPASDVRRRVYGLSLKPDARIEVTGTLRPPEPDAAYPFPTLEGPGLVIRLGSGSKIKRRSGDYI